MTSSPERRRHQRVREHLSKALDLPHGERRGYLENTLRSGETLDEALELLGEVEGLDDFLTKPLGLKGSGAEEYSPPVPEEVAGFKVDRVLGWGAMGVVYLARQESPRRQVALKLLRVDAASPAAAARLEREANALARLSHPGIAQIYSAGFTNLGTGEQPYIAMEFVSGRPLGRFITDEALDLRQRVQLFLEITDAVQHAHEHGVLHRDLKPDNVIVDDSGHPRVLDFGVSRVVSEDEVGLTLTGTGQLVGTVAYMAPEQARGAAIDDRADLYALGTILYEILANELPIDVRGRLTHDALRAVATGDVVPIRRRVPEVGRDLEAVVGCALASERELRYRSVAEFSEDLRNWLAGRPINAKPPGRTGQLKRFIARNRAISAVAAILLVGLGAALATWAYLQQVRGFQDVLRDRREYERLIAEEQALWPTNPALLPEFDAWLEDMQGLLEGLELHRGELETLRGGKSLLLASEFVTEWQTEAEQLIELLELVASKGGALEAVRLRRGDLAELEGVLVQQAEAWESVRERVAADPRFDGYFMEFIPGLVPLGADPVSGLEEFALWRFTGDAPQRDGSGQLQVSEETGAVFVLIPGGDALVGAQNMDEDGENYDPSARPNTEDMYANEGPPIRVRLDPFLISKYELTQGQWVRAFGFNPSDWEVGSRPYPDEPAVNAAHPVESVSWAEAMTYLPRIGLTLPTEAQWEVAARAGADGAYGVDAGWEALIGQVNGVIVTDDAGQVLADDGYRLHMPVGSFDPNPYGLHDVLGNVWEVCMDIYKVRYHSCWHDEGTGLVQADWDGDISRRGPGMSAHPRAMRMARRAMRLFDQGDSLTGLRPAIWLSRDARVQVSGAGRAIPRGPR